MWSFGGPETLAKECLPVRDLVHRAFLRRLLGARTGTPNMVMLAEVGRYPLVGYAAKMLCKFWNRLVEMEDGEASFSAKCRVSARCPLSRSASSHTSWAAQLAKALLGTWEGCHWSSIRVSILLYLNLTVLYFFILLSFFETCRTGSKSLDWTRASGC